MILNLKNVVYKISEMWKKNWKKFSVKVGELSNGRIYTIHGRIFFNDKIIFYLPFEPTINDFSIILRKFSKKYANYNLPLKMLIQPARYGHERDGLNVGCQ